MPVARVIIRPIVRTAIDEAWTVDHRAAVYDRSVVVVRVGRVGDRRCVDYGRGVIAAVSVTDGKPRDANRYTERIPRRSGRGDSRAAQQQSRGSDGSDAMFHKSSCIVAKGAT